MSNTLSKAVKTQFSIKGGETFNVGEIATISWENGSESATVTINGRTTKLNSALLYKKFAGFTKPPTLHTMEGWMSKGISKTVLGHSTEPDGTGLYNEPNWIRLMGLI